MNTDELSRVLHLLADLIKQLPELSDVVDSLKSDLEDMSAMLKHFEELFAR